MDEKMSRILAVLLITVVFADYKQVYGNYGTKKGYAEGKYMAAFYAQLRNDVENGV